MNVDIFVAIFCVISYKKLDNFNWKIMEVYQSSLSMCDFSAHNL
jgi:hypothetical protein